MRKSTLSESQQLRRGGSRRLTVDGLAETDVASYCPASLQTYGPRGAVFGLSSAARCGAVALPRGR